MPSSPGSQPRLPAPAPAGHHLIDQVIALSPVGIALVDADGCYASVNPAYCSIYGCSAAELLGSRFTRVYPAAQQDEAMQRHRSVLSGAVLPEAEREVQRPDGRHITVQVRSVRVAAADGRLQRLVYVNDITALKQAERTLQDSQALLLDLAASIPGAVFRLHRHAGRWRVTYCSPGIQALFGLTPAQVCADIRALARLVLPGDLAAHDASIRQALARGCGFEQEVRIRSTDGQLKWVHAKAVPRPGADGSVVWTGLLDDITARKQLEAAQRSNEERYRTLFETVPQGVVYQDASGRITAANQAAQRILGLTLAQLQGRQSIDPRWQALREDGSPFPGREHPAMVALQTGQPVRNVVMGVAVPDPARPQVWLLVNSSPVHRDGQVVEVYSTLEDITERVHLSRELKRQATTDDLTGTANRRSLMQRLGAEFAQVRQAGGSHRCAVLAIDLDLFKQVNDSFGHAAGDAVLQHAAELMRRVTRAHDLVARSGGEEFMLLLPGTPAADAHLLAERLRGWLQAQPVLHQGRALVVTVSIGVSEILPADADLDAVLARADLALYRAKAGGRNQVCMAALPG